MVGDRPGDPAGSQLEVGHRAAAELQQDPHVRAIRRDGIWYVWQLHGVKTLVHKPLRAALVAVSRYQYYLHSARDTPDEAEWRTEIGWPIFRADGSSRTTRA